MSTRAPSGSAMSWKTAVIDLAERGVRSSVVRIAKHRAQHDRFVPAFLPHADRASAKEKGAAGLPRRRARTCGNAVHGPADVASLFRLALEKGPGRQILARGWGTRASHSARIAEAIGSRLGLPAVNIPRDELMLPGYFGFLANIVTQSYPASSLITPPDPRLGTRSARPARRSGQRPLTSPPADGRGPRIATSPANDKDTGAVTAARRGVCPRASAGESAVRGGSSQPQPTLTQLIVDRLPPLTPRTSCPVIAFGPGAGQPPQAARGQASDEPALGAAGRRSPSGSA